MKERRRKKMKILLIEDDAQLSRSIKESFQEAGYDVEIAHDGLSGYKRAVAGDFQAAIVDVMLPLMDGLTVIKKIRSSGAKLPILVLSAKRSVDDRVIGLETGGDDYLVKPFSFPELLARTRALIRRSEGVRREVEIQAGDIRLDRIHHKVFYRGEPVELLPKEYELLEYLVHNKGRVLTRTQIIERVWGYNFDPESNIIDVHICKLRERLGDNSTKRLIRTIRGVGYVLEG